MDKSKTSYIVIGVLVVAFVIILISIFSGKDNAEQSEIKEANINSAEVLMLESFPVQVNLFVKGDLSDACTEYNDADIQRNQEGFDVYVTTKRPLSATCAQVMGTFEETISLPVAGLPQGDYVVMVNGVEANFSFLVDNFISDEDPQK